MKEKFGLLVIGGLLLVAVASMSMPTSAPRSGMAQGSTSHYFPETSHTVKDTFLNYWQTHGGLTQQGYPISEEFRETSDLDGKTYTVQYFERAVLEKHPENKPPYDVLLSQLGAFQYKAKYSDAGAPNQQPSAQNSRQFKETGFYVGGLFLAYWDTHGGLAQQGFPISNEFTEVSELDGKPYTVQYFERAVFELHPENPAPYNILLSQLGAFQLKKKYPNGAPGGGGEGTPQPTAAATQSPATPPTRTPTQTAATPHATAGSPAPTTQAQPTPTHANTGTNCEPVADSKKSRISSAGAIAIANVQYSGKEYVEIKNNAGAAADLSGWLLRDKNETKQNYRFPDGTQLPAGGGVQVYTEPGHPYSFNRKSSIWNNCGDALELLDGNGAVVATYAYGTHLIK